MWFHMGVGYFHCTVTSFSVDMDMGQIQDYFFITFFEVVLVLFKDLTSQ